MNRTGELLRRAILRAAWKAGRSEVGWTVDDEDPLVSPRAAEADYLIAKGTLVGGVGADGGVHVRLSAGGRDLVDRLISTGRDGWGENERVSIEEDSEQLLAILSEFELKPGDPKKGRHNLPGGSLSELTSWPADRVNDAVETLNDDGLVETYDTLGTAPYSFAGVEVTTAGRRQYQASSKQRTSAATGESMPPTATVDPRKVFVIHGRDLAKRDAVFAFLRSLDLSPIEFDEAVHNTGDGSPYVGDVLDAAFSQAHAVVALFTGDDEARLKDEFREKHEQSEALTPQPRQNVLFEAGMAFGRDAKRTVILVSGRVRPFTDIQGRHVIHLNGTPEVRKKIADRLKVVGCAVDIEGKTGWLSAGDL